MSCDLSGQIIKGYELRECIGMGGFGAVYRAFQPVVTREVAIKVILPQYANHPDFIRRFEVEAQLVAQLEHPHIVPLYDYWREPDGAYLVMRLLSESLHHRLTRGPLPLADAGRLINQVAAALAVAHRHGVIHRDLKPANILLDAEGNAYLADFGIAKTLHQATDTTQAGTIIGAPAYLAPEQIKSEAITPSTDIYCLGVVLFETLTGKHPFCDETTPTGLMHKHLHEPLPSLREARPDVPATLDEVIQHATAKIPGDRYRDALQVAVALREAIGSPTAFETVPVGSDTIELVDDERTWTPVDELVTVRNPYKGLRAFEEADAADFFGRNQLVEQLLARLAEQGTYARFLAVVGPSGSGKSSAVSAGLLPALRAGRLPGSDEWFMAEMLPGTHPMEEVELALIRIAAAPELNLLPLLRQDERGLLRAIRRILPDNTTLLLIIDQFEETFTLVNDPAEVAHFMESLCAALTDPHTPLRVIITLRADFYDRPLMHPGFSQLVRQRTEVVTPMLPRELEQAIILPAERAAVTLEPGLTAAMVADTHEQPGALPMLQYALTELFERREDQALTLDAYNTIGGVLGALTHRADEIYESLSTDQQAAARQLFLRLVTLGEGTEDTRRRTLQSELISVGGGTMQTVIDAFDRSRLLTFDRDPVTRSPTIEVAHEALLREWQRLQAWLDESRHDIRQQRLLAAATHEWLMAERDPGFLLHNTRLAQFEIWASDSHIELTNDEQDYLNASIAERERQADLQRAQEVREARLRERVQRVLQVLVVVFLVAFMVSGGLALWVNSERARAEDEKSRAQAAEHEARHVQSLLLSDLSQQQLVAGDKRRATLLALAALQYYETGIYDPDMRQALVDALAACGTENMYMRHLDTVKGASWNADKTRILTWSPDRTARVWDVETGAELVVLRHTEELLGAVWNADETRILTWTWEGTAWVWDVATGEPLLALRHDNDVIEGAAWNNEETQILTWSRDQTARVWDAYSGDTLLTLRHGGELVGATWNSDETQILTWSADRTAQVWDAQSGAPLLTLHHRAEVKGALWNSDETLILTWSADATVQAWDAQSGAPLLTLHHRAEVRGALWDSDETLILTWSADATAQVWDAQNGAPLLLLAHDGPVAEAMWNENGKRLLTRSENHVFVWDAAKGERLFDLQHDAEIEGMLWHSNDDQVLTWSSDHTARVWDSDTGKLLVTLHHDDILGGAIWNDDGTLILTWSSDHTARLWDTRCTNPPLVLRHDKTVRGAMWSPSALQVLSWADDATARVWDAHTGAELFALNHDRAVSGATWNSDGTRIVTWSRDATARVWDAHTGAELFVLNHDRPVLGARWNANETQLITWAMDATVRIWDTATGAELFMLPHQGSVSDAMWNSDGTQVLSRAGSVVFIWSASSGTNLLTLNHDEIVKGAFWNKDETAILTWTGYPDNTVRIWDANSGDIATSFPHALDVLGAAWNEDETRLLTWSVDSFARVWDVATGKELTELPSQGQVLGAEWDQDETRLLTWSLGSKDVWIWDATSGEPLLVLRHDNDINGAKWSNDNTKLLTFSIDGTVRVWDAENGSLILTLNVRDPVLGAAWNADETQILTWSASEILQVWLVDVDRLLALARQIEIRPMPNSERDQFYLPTLVPTSNPGPLPTIDLTRETDER